MRRKNIALLLLAIAVGGGAWVEVPNLVLADKDCNVRILEDKNVVTLAVPSYLNVREYPNSNCKIVGVLRIGEVAYLTGEVVGNWSKVTNSTGDIEGYVYTPYTLNCKGISDMVRKGSKAFTLTAKVKEVTGGYTSKSVLRNRSIFEYDSELKIRRNAIIYKTPSKDKYIKGEYNIEKYVVASGGGITAYDMDSVTSPAIKGKIRKGDKCRVLSEYNSYYLVDYKGESIVKKEDCEIQEKKVKVSNIADSKDFVGNTYNLKTEGKLLGFVRNGYDYYVSPDDVKRTNTVTKGSAKVVIEAGVEYEVLDYSYGSKYIQLVAYNELGDATVVWVEADAITLKVYYEDMEVVDDEDSDEVYDDSNYSDVFKPDTSNKEKYSYDYKNNSTDERNDIVNYALTFLGNPYRYGGEDLYRGIDCSAFCMRVLQHFDIACGRSTAVQVSESRGRDIKAEDLQPGDLIYYTKDGVNPYHVVMYLGKDKCVNASCKKDGICISNIKTDRILKIKNYID